MTLIETFLLLLVIGWLLFLGYCLGTSLEAYIEEKANEAVKRNDANKEADSK